MLTFFVVLPEGGEIVTITQNLGVQRQFVPMPGPVSGLAPTSQGPFLLYGTDILTPDPAPAGSAYRFRNGRLVNTELPGWNGWGAQAISDGHAGIWYVNEHPALVRFDGAGVIKRYSIGGAPQDVRSICRSGKTVLVSRANVGTLEIVHEGSGVSFAPLPTDVPSLNQMAVAGDRLYGIDRAKGRILRKDRSYRKWAALNVSSDVINLPFVSLACASGWLLATINDGRLFAVEVESGKIWTSGKRANNVLAKSASDFWLIHDRSVERVVQPKMHSEGWKLAGIGVWEGA